MKSKQSWGLSEGDEIVPGRSALQRLGGGVQYETYLAWDEALLQVVVAKLLRPGYVDRERALADLRREAAALDALAHPVILRGFGAVLEGPRPHLVLEHLSGPTLSRLLKRYGPLPLEQLLPLSLSICSALHYLSVKKRVHLDVKPSNIVMGTTPRLIDLSILRTLEEAAAGKGGMGTRRYMAPEQVDPATFGAIGSPADVWGIGITMYEATSGRSAFPDSDDSEGHRQTTDDPLPLPEDVPEQLSALIMRCLDKDQRARPTAAELVGELEMPVARIPRPRLRRRRPRLS